MSSNKEESAPPYPEEPDPDIEEQKKSKSEMKDVESRGSSKKQVQSMHIDNKQNWFRKNLLLLVTVGSVLLGTSLGLVGRQFISKDDKDTITLIGFPGEILMRMFKCIIIPLITASLITGVANTNLKQSTRMAVVAILYYVSTTVLATITGIILVNTIRPGKGVKFQPKEEDDDEKPDKVPPTSTLNIIMDLIRNIFPDNLIQSTMMQTATKAKYYNQFNKTTHMLMRCCINGTSTSKICLDGIDGNRTMDIKEGIYYWTYGSNNFNITNNSTRMEYGNCTNGAMESKIIGPQLENGMNSLGVIFICIAIGAVLSKLGKRGRAMVDLFEILDLITMRLVMLILWYVPIGIMSLIMERIIASDDLIQMATNLGFFTLTVMGGLSIHAFISLPLLYFGLTRKNPLTFVRGLVQAMTVAFSTSSSAATLPVTFHCLENNLGIDTRVTRFVLPVGTTINMDGTALYEAVSAIFIAQMNHRDMGIGEVIIVSLMATLASVGAAAIPNSGFVTTIMVLNAVGLPIKDLGMIYALDWLLDRFRTAINVMGDAYGAGIVQHFCKDHLPPMTMSMMQEDEYNALENPEPEPNSEDDSHMAV